MLNKSYVDLHEIYLNLLLFFLPASVVLIFLTDFSFSSYISFISFGSYVDALIMIFLVTTFVLFLRFISKIIVTGVLSIFNYEKVIKFPHSDIRMAKDTTRQKYSSKFIFVRTAKENIRGYRKLDD